jgi:hypothetical protein
MRIEYDYLTEETEATLEGNVKAVASGWNKSGSFVYAVLSGGERDYFAPFYEMYKGVVKGGVSTCHWDNALEYARQRYGKKTDVRSETECFKNHTETHSKTMVRFIEALKDGNLNLEEIHDLEKCLNDEETNLQMIRTMLNFKKGVLGG